MGCRGEVEDPQCEEPSEVAQECCSEVYDGTLLNQAPSTSRSLVAGNSVYIPYYSTVHSMSRRTMRAQQQEQ